MANSNKIFSDEDITSQSLFKSQEFLEVEATSLATVAKTKEIQTQQNVSAQPQTMPESPLQSFVIQPANPKTGCYPS